MKEPTLPTRQVTAHLQSQPSASFSTQWPPPLINNHVIVGSYFRVMLCVPSDCVCCCFSILVLGPLISILDC
jgi:hypothetical protein